MRKTIVITDFRVNECRNAANYCRLAEEAIASCFGECRQAHGWTLTYLYFKATFYAPHADAAKYEVLIIYRSQMIAVTQEIL